MGLDAKVPVDENQIFCMQLRFGAKKSRADERWNILKAASVCEGKKLNRYENRFSI